MVIRQRQSFPHKRLGLGLLLSTLVHATLLVPPARPTPMVLQIPAPELSVAISTDHRPMAASMPDPLPATRQATAMKALATDPLSVTSSAPSASDTAANHLRSLLHESLNRYFIYPPVAHRNGWEGQVKLLVHLDRDGRLHALRVVQSSGYPLLDDDALLTLRRIGSIPQARAWLPERGYATTLPVVYKLTES